MGDYANENLVTVREGDASALLELLGDENVTVNSSETEGDNIDYSFDGTVSPEGKEAIASIALHTYYVDEQ